MRMLIVIPAGIVLVAGAYLLGRSGVEPPSPPLLRDRPAPEPLPAAPPVIAEKVPPPSVPKLEDIRAELKRSLETRPAALNDLHNFLLSALGEGRLSAQQVLEMFRAESDVAVLDVLQGALCVSPDAADEPGIRIAFDQMAKADACLGRRQAAIAFLGAAWDRDGSVRKTLLSLADSDGDLSVRLTALGALAGYSQKNGTQAAAVNAGLMDLVRTGSGGDELRTQALSGIEVHGADEGTLRRLAEFLSDASGSVRLATAERMAEAPPAFRASTLAALEGAIYRESLADAKPLLLAHLVKAGRAEAISSLERVAAAEPRVRADAQDYLAILRAGFVDWSDIAAEKSKRETSR
ncbi:MAG: hypothetical protein HY293_16160 [Planctomycetes bacterium]|nr:hypothetical protein [Planctomycetota bacterium]